MLAVSAAAAFAETPTIQAGISVDGLIESNHWKQALQLTQARLASNPMDAQAHAWMSKIKEGFGDLSAAVAEGQRAIELDQRVAAFHAQLGEACAMTADEVHTLKVISMVHCMNREIDKTLALDPKNIDIRIVHMMYTWKAPGFAGGDKKLAQRIAEDIRGISPSWGYLALARLMQDMDNDPVKEDLLKKAVEVDPKFYRARMALATFYAVNAHQKHYDLAEKLGQGMLALDPSNEGGYEILARVYAAASRWKELDELLERSSKAAPEDLGPCYAAAEVLIDNNADPTRAARYLERYLSQPPEARQPTHAKARALQAKLPKNL
jgi:tetratricopeptide (TPR) repeat protein